MMPKTLRIGGKTYPVNLTHEKEMGTFLGEIRYTFQEIRVREQQCEDGKRETLLHEVLHAASDLGHSEVPEPAIDSLSKCLFGIFRDNPELVKWMMEENAP